MALVMQAAAPLATARFSGAAAMVGALEHLAARARVVGLACRRGAWAAALVAALAAVVVLAGRLHGPGSRRRPPVAGAYAVEAQFLRHGAGSPEMLAGGDAVAPGDRLSLRWRSTRDRLGLRAQLR